MNYLILALATWRITSLLWTEDGPCEVFARLRERVGVYYDEGGQRQGRNEVAKAFNCPACLSVWVGGAVAVAYWVTDATIWLCLPLALSAVTIIIEEWMNGKS